MKTSPRQPSRSGREKSMFSQADFPVSPSAMQEAEKERKMTATSGLKCYERFGRYNPAVSLKWDVQTFSSKKVLYVEKNTGTSSMPSVKTLSEKDMKSNRLLFQLVPQERPIEETGYGLLPTVQTQGLKRCNKKGKTEFLPLHLLPTPTAAEATKYTTKLNSKSQMGMGLTALAMNGKLPSPKKVAEETGGSQGSRQFNPLYAEEMMGFPSMWTTLPFLKENGERNP